MNSLKITSWNIAHLDCLTKCDLGETEQKRREAIVRELRELSPDILCLIEGPKGEEAIDQVSNELLKGKWVAVKAPNGEYATQGTQWIWFLVRHNFAAQAALLSPQTWDAFTSRFWEYHLWGEFQERKHQHYRHPQVLVFNWNGFRVEFIGLHLKSKFINQGARLWHRSEAERQEFIRKALSARIKMTTEAANVRAYIDAKFKQVENPAIFVMGDLNDGPGKEYFEERFLFFDLISNIQGDIFSATKFLNHALFDSPNQLRWSVYFKDFVEPTREPHILLDHILFTQGLVNGSLPWKIDAHAGKVEHEIHDLINATLPSKAKTSDHRPISLIVKTG